MKNKLRFFICCLSWVLLISGCKNEQVDIPSGYVVDKSCYLSDGNGLYAFIEIDSINYEVIRRELCNGNAGEIKEQYESKAIMAEDSHEYAATQNILGVTEVFLGDYERAYEYFLDAIAVLDKHKLQEENKILAVLYNNVGAVTFNLPRQATVDERLEKAAKLCKDPYLRLVISINQSCRLKENAVAKEYGEMILQCNELIHDEKQLVDSPYLVTFMAVRQMGVGYLVTGQEERGIIILDEYIPLVPETAEYSIIKSVLLGQRGHCYYRRGEYDKSIANAQEAVLLAEKTLDASCRQLALEYARLANGYVGKGKWRTALLYFEKSHLGYGRAATSHRATLYYNMGYVCWELEEYEEAKMYFLKSYADKQAIIEDVGNAVGEGYDSQVKERLHEIYQSEDGSASFHDWLERELKQTEQ